MLNEPQFKACFIKNVKSMVRAECHNLASKKFSSKFKINDVKNLASIKLTDLSAELEENAPTTFNALCGITQRPPTRENKRRSDTRIVTSFGLLINQRNRNMNALQQILCVLLYRAKDRVKVRTIHTLFYCIALQITMQIAPYRMNLFLQKKVAIFTSRI